MQDDFKNYQNIDKNLANIGMSDPDRQVKEFKLFLTFRTNFWKVWEFLTIVLPSQVFVLIFNSKHYLIDEFQLKLNSLLTQKIL